MRRTPGPIGRRAFLAQSAIGSGAFLAACARPVRPSSSGAGSGSGSTPNDSSLTPQRTGVFQTVGYRQLENLNPWKIVNANIAFYLQGVFDSLVSYEYKPFGDYRETYKIVPSLAEQWESPDNNTYVFHIRKNVQWHDGTPFTAADVKWSYEYMADAANKIAVGDLVRPIQSMAMPDDNTLKITTKAASASFLEGLQGSTKILAKHVHDRGDEFEKVAVGTGPFKVDSYDPQKGVVYVANKNYWKSGMPFLDKFKLLAPTDEAGRLAGFSAGQNDVLHLTNKRQTETVLPLVKGAKSFTFIRDVTGDMYLKLDKPPFSDKRIRQAVQVGIDRGEMQKTMQATDGLMNPPGINALAKGWVIPPDELNKMPGWRTPKELDIQDAKQLLAAAGYSNGGLSFTLAVDQAVDYVGAEATVVAEQLRRLGITVNLRPLESGVYTRNFTSGDYDAVIDATGGSRPMNSGAWQQRLHSGGFFNKMPINDSEIDRLVDAQAQEFDEAKRKALCIDMERILARETYLIPLIALPGYFVGQPYVHGWVDLMALNVNDMDWGQTWFDQASAPKGRS